MITTTFKRNGNDFYRVVVDSYHDAIDYANEFIGGHPPHFPVPTRPK